VRSPSAGFVARFIAAAFRCFGVSPVGELLLFLLGRIQPVVATLHSIPLTGVFIYAFKSQKSVHQ